MKKTILLITLLQISLLFTQQVEFGLNIPVAAGSVQQRFPDFHIDSNTTIHIVWVEQVGNSKNVYYSNSQDFGLSFSEKIRVNSIVNHVVAYTGGGPRVRSNGNQVFVIWADSRNGYDNTSIFMSSSVDNGLNWEEEFEVSDQPHFQLYGEIEIDENGTGHLVYYNFDASLWIHDVRYSSFNSLMITPSIDIGITSDSQEPCDCCAPDLEISTDGTVYIAFRNNINDVRDHYITRKPSGSNEFDTAVPIAELNDVIGFCPASSPSISIGPNWIGVGFMNYSQGSTLMTWGDSGSLTFSDPVSVPDLGGVTNYPSVQVMDNKIHTAWVDASSGTVEFASMDIETTGISNSQPITDLDSETISSSEPKLSTKDNELYCVWSDNRTGLPNIYFTTTFEIEFMPGDVDGDLLVNVMDILLVVNNIIGIGDLTTTQFLAADMTGDQSINILDVIQIVNLILGN